MSIAKFELSDAMTFPAMIVFGGIVPVLLGAGSPRTLATALITAGAVYSGCRFGATLFGAVPRTFMLIDWFYLYVFLGLAPLAQLRSAYWPLGGVDQRSLETAAEIVLTFMLTYDLGAVWLRRRPLGGHRRPRWELAPRRLAWLAPIAVAIALYEVAHLGGFQALFVSREDMANALSTGPDASGGSQDISRALLLYPVFVCAYAVLVAKRFRRLRGKHAIGTGLVFLALLLSNPIATPRYVLGTVYLGLVFAWIWPLSRKQLALLGLALLMGIFVLFPALNFFRVAAHRTVQSTSVAEQLTHGDFDSFQQIANTATYVHERGHTLGKQEVSAILFFIPRSLWSEKSIGTGQLIGRFAGYQFTNLSSPLPAEAYIDGGLLWVAVVGFGFGVGAQWGESTASSIQKRTTFIGLLIPILAVYQVILLRGSLLSSMGGISAIAAFMWLSTRRVPESANEQTIDRVRRLAVRSSKVSNLP